MLDTDWLAPHNLVMASESTWLRAWKDSERIRKESSWWFWGPQLLGGLVSGALGGWIAATHLSDESTSAQEFWYPASGSIAGVAIGIAMVFLLIFCWSLFRSPYRQRDEARSTVRNLLETASLQFLGFGLSTVENRDHASLVTSGGQEVQYFKLQLELKFRNRSKIPIQYDIKDMEFTLEGIGNSSPQMNSWGAVVPPQSDNIFRYDWVAITSDHSPMYGDIHYLLESWPVGTPSGRRREQYAFALTYWPQQNKLDWVIK